MSVTFRHATLDNGLNIIAEVAPHAHTAAVGFFVRTGARDEARSLMGVSHFLEHMMFKGTDTRSAEDVDREFDDLGVNHNAFTTTELTAFYTHGLPEALGPSTRILADILRPALREEDFESEKKVILEEIAMYADNPFWNLYERTMEAYYDGHGLGHRVLGLNETIATMTAEQMRAYFNHRYSADNTVVALAGQVDFDAIVEQLRADCGRWQTTHPVRDNAPSPRIETSFTFSLPNVNRHYMLMLCPAPGVQDDQRYAAGILAQILGDSEGSRLYWALVETGLADEAQAQASAHDGMGDYLIYASCSPDQAEQVRGTIQRELESLVDSITEDDLLRVRSKVATAATLHSELPGGRMRRLGQYWTYHQRYRSLEEELAKINAVTLRDLRAVAETYPIRPQVIAQLTPERAAVPA